MLRYCDSFDHYSQYWEKTWDLVYSTSVSVASEFGSYHLSATGRHGTNGLRVRGGTMGVLLFPFNYIALRRTLTPTMVGGGVFGTALWWSDNRATKGQGEDPWLVSFHNGIGVMNFILSINKDGFLYIPGILTADRPLAPGIYGYVEVEALPTQVTLKLNGRVVGRAWGSWSWTWTHLLIGQAVGMGNDLGWDYRFDDFYLFDLNPPSNSFAGDCRVWCLRPNAAGAYTEWNSFGAATGHEATNDIIHNSDSDYISSNVANAREIFHLDDVPVRPNDIHGAQISLIAKKEEFGNRAIRPLLRLGSTDVEGSDVFLSTTYVTEPEVFPFDPNGDPWTVTAVNALQAGARNI